MNPGETQPTAVALTGLPAAPAPSARRPGAAAVFFGNTSAIFGRELGAYFFSPTAYIILTAFVGLTGLFFFIALQRLAQPDTVVQNVGSVQFMLLIFVTPMLTMRLLAEEKRSGTLEMLVTTPVSDTQIVLGKFLACWTMYVVLLLPSVLYLGYLAHVSKPDWGPVLCQYAGLLMVGAAFVGIGLWLSAMTSNQVIAGVVTFILTFLFGIMGWVGGYIEKTSGDSAIWKKVSVVFNYIGLFDHFDHIAAGVLDLRDVIYFASVTIMCLFLSVRSLEMRRWN